MEEYKIDVSVIVPCYNEEGNIEECVKSIPRLSSRMEVIIVNDGSEDKTKEKACRISCENENVKLIDLPRNKGKTTAVKTALEKAKGWIIMIHDADLSVDGKYLNLFYEKFISEPDSFLMGTRLLSKIDIKAMPIKNFIANKIAAAVFSFFLRQEITDTLCGIKVFPSQLKEQLVFTNCRWPDFDLILAAKKTGLKIEEVPVKYEPRKYGQSAMRIYPDSWQLFKRLIKAIWQLNG
jgi:glycosyltransferase involved in cell wall biosynthesis